LIVSELKELLMGSEGKSKGALSRLSCLLFFSILLAGCETIGFERPPLEFGSAWVSTVGKSQDQFHTDQADCRRDVSMNRSQTTVGPGGNTAEKWDMSEFRAFESCMRAKGWKKE